MKWVSNTRCYEQLEKILQNLGNGVFKKMFYDITDKI